MGVFLFFCCLLFIKHCPIGNIVKKFCYLQCYLFVGLVFFL